ncbi:MAG TPA: hypothetical protein VM888_03320 [Chitinophagaceae bacterium]|nr:hypothetical protein [Chitinophagaceae bacterium]
MKRLLLSFLLTNIISYGTFAQDAGGTTKGLYKRQHSIGISFVLNDYETPALIRNRSLESVIGNKQLAKFNQMSPGLALTYFRGVHDNIDFAGTIAGSFIDNPLNNRNGSSNNFLAEADASFNFKMFSDQYWFTPYLSAGVGASKYKSYYAAILPLGGGLKVNLFDEAAIFLNAHYRVPITPETNDYHLFYNIGIAGIIGKKKGE